MAKTNCKLLYHIKTHKLQCFIHVMRNSKDNTEGSVTTELVEGTRKHSRPNISKIDNITMWNSLSGSDLLRAVQIRKLWQSCTHLHGRLLHSDNGMLHNMINNGKKCYHEFACIIEIYDGSYGVMLISFAIVCVQIALVGQEPVLYGRSIKDNIAYGMDKWDLEQVKRAAMQANAHSFITEMKDQYETEAGEKGTHLSGTDKVYIIN